MDKIEKLGGGIVDIHGKPIHQELKSVSHPEIGLSYVDGKTFGRFGKVASSPYKENGTIRRAIDIMAYNLAQLPFNVYDKGIKLAPVVDDPNNVHIGSLLEYPNENMSGFKFKLLHWSYFLLYDKVYWLINRNPYGIIKELYVLNPRMVKEHKGNSGAIDFYTYGKLKITVDDIIEFSGFDPGTLSGMGGCSILDTLRVEYETDAAAAVYGKKFFENGTRVSGVISVDKDVPVTNDQMQKVLSLWIQAHQGSDNAYKVGALLNGMKYEERGMSMRDAEFINGRKEIKDRIIEVYGIPKSVFGLVDKIDRATADTQMRQFWQVTLKPLAIMMQEDANATLMRKNFPGLTIKYDFTVVEELKKDVNETIKAARQYFELGYTRNEVNDRFKLGMESNDDGDTRYIPTTLISIDDSLEMDVLDEPTKEVDDIVVIKSIETKAANPFRVRFLKDQSNQEKLFQSKIKRYLFEYRKEVLDIINGQKANIETNTIINALNALKNKQDSKLFKISTPLYTEASRLANQGTYDVLGFDSKATTNTALVNASANRIKGINKTLNDKIVSEIKIGAEAGETIDQLSTRVKGVYNFTTSRSKIIARTESANIMNASALASYKERGVTHKIWLDAGDNEVRDAHKANKNQGAIPINESFSSGELYPNSVNCRCSIAAEIKI